MIWARKLTATIRPLAVVARLLSLRRLIAAPASLTPHTYKGIQKHLPIGVTTLISMPARQIRLFRRTLQIAQASVAGVTKRASFYRTLSRSITTIANHGIGSNLFRLIGRVISLLLPTNVATDVTQVVLSDLESVVMSLSDSDTTVFILN
jgi:hypothetical protein